MLLPSTRDLTWLQCFYRFCHLEESILQPCRHLIFLLILPRSTPPLQRSFVIPHSLAMSSSVFPPPITSTLPFLYPHLLSSPLVFFPFHPPIRAATQWTLPSRLLLRASASGIPLCDYLQSSDTIQVMQGLVQTAPCGRVKGIGSAVLCTAYLQIPCRY